MSNRHLRFQVFLGVRRVALLDFPQVCVDNGEWHHVLVELKSGKDGKDIKYMALVSLDYGVFQVYYLLSILLCIFICRPPKFWFKHK